MADRPYETANSILAAARECDFDGKAFRQLPGGRALALIDRVVESFTVGGTANRHVQWLWEHLRDPRVSLNGPHDLSALQALGSSEDPIWLLVEDWARTKKGPPFWVFEASLNAATATLKNHHLLEFYIVSRSFDWLVGENHHEVLFGVGEHAVKILQSFAY